MTRAPVTLLTTLLVLWLTSDGHGQLSHRPGPLQADNGSPVLTCIPLPAVSVPGQAIIVCDLADNGVKVSVNGGAFLNILIPAVSGPGSSHTNAPAIFLDSSSAKIGEFNPQALCTGIGAPRPCCTGLGTGACFPVFNAATGELVNPFGFQTQAQQTLGTTTVYAESTNAGAQTVTIGAPPVLTASRDCRALADGSFPSDCARFVAYGGAKAGTLVTTGSDFIQLSGANVSATEANVKEGVAALNVYGMVVALDTPPGSGVTRTMTLNKNGSATAITCTITGVSAKRCTFSTITPVAYADGDMWDVGDVVSGGTAGAAGVGVHVIYGLVGF